MSHGGLRPLAAALLCFVASQTAGQGRSARSFYEPNPVLEDRRPVRWRKGAPQNVGLDAGKLKAASDVLTRRPASRAFLVVRKGRLAWERYFHGATARESRNVHSVSKSLLGALVGIAIREEKLQGPDHRLIEGLGDFLPASPDPRRRLTVRHLLTMTAGLAWTEDVTEYEIQRAPNWVHAILTRPLTDRPGTRFRYSTGNTHVLSALLTKRTRQPTHAYARSRLLKPLGITVDRWGRHDPQGFDSGGCNVYMTPRELARLGVLFLQRGTWKKKALVPAAWIAESWKPRQRVGGAYHYGYLWWLFEADGHSVSLAWGYGGQFVFVVPSLELVAVVTSDTAATPSGKKLDPATFARQWLVTALRKR